MKTSFNKGWGELKVKHTEACRDAIKRGLKIKSDQQFFVRRRGEIEHSREEIRVIECVFRNFGVSKTKVWGTEYDKTKKAIA